MVLLRSFLTLSFAVATRWRQSKRASHGIDGAQQKRRRRLSNPATSRTSPMTPNSRALASAIMPSGAKSWIVEYRPGAGGRSVAKRRLSLGATTLLTAAQARSKAKDHLAPRGSATIRRRGDHRTRNPCPIDCHPEYLTDVEATLAPGTARIYRHYLTYHASRSSARARSRASTIPTSQASREHRKKNPVTANRVMATLSSLFGFARKAGLVPATSIA